MQEEPQKPEPEKPSFLAILKTLEDGHLEGDLTDDITQLVHDMRALAHATGAKLKGKVQVTLEVKLDGGIFEIIPSYKIVAPKKPRSRSIYYATKAGGLSTHNQAQGNLSLGPGKDVTGGRPLAIA